MIQVDSDERIIVGEDEPDSGQVGLVPLERVHGRTEVRPGFRCGDLGELAVDRRDGLLAPAVRSPVARSSVPPTDKLLALLQFVRNTSRLGVDDRLHGTCSFRDESIRACCVGNNAPTVRVV